MGVTIVANEFSEVTQKKLQEEADKLANDYHYSNYAIMHHFAKKRLSVSMGAANGQIIMNCRSVCR